MTRKELERFNYGNKLYEKINSIESEIEHLETNFNKDIYPRSESNWNLSLKLNDRVETIFLDSTEFWQCFDTVLNSRRNKLNELRKEFSEL